jgi:hypothetical protein
MIFAIALRAHALAPSQPSITSEAIAGKASITQSDVSPVTTEAPSVYELRKRQESVIEFVRIAPNFIIARS